MGAVQAPVGETRTRGLHPLTRSSATPFSLRHASSPSATPFFLVQWAFLTGSDDPWARIGAVTGRAGVEWYWWGSWGGPGRGVSKSVTKAPRAGIGREGNRGISTFLLRHPGAIRAFATDLDNLHRRGPREDRRGPLHGRRPRRSPRSRAGPLRPERRDVHFALERALLTAHLECKMHISTSTGPTRPQHPERLPPASPRADSGPRTAAPGEGGLSELGDGVKGSNRTLHRPHDGDAPRGRSGAPADTKEAAQRGARLGHEGARRS